MQMRGKPTDLAGAAGETYATDIWGVALASFAAAISGTIDSGFDLLVLAQQTTCVSAMPQDHFGCASWRDKNATKKNR